MYQPMMSANNLAHMQQAAQQVMYQPMMSGNNLGQAMMLVPIPQNGNNIINSTPGINNAAPQTSEEKEAPPHAFPSNNRSLYPRDTQYPTDRKRDSDVTKSDVKPKRHESMSTTRTDSSSNASPTRSPAGGRSNKLSSPKHKPPGRQNSRENNSPAGSDSNREKRRGRKEDNTKHGGLERRERDDDRGERREVNRHGERGERDDRGERREDNRHGERGERDDRGERRGMDNRHGERGDYERSRDDCDRDYDRRDDDESRRDERDTHKRDDDHRDQDRRDDHRNHRDRRDDHRDRRDREPRERDERYRSGKCGDAEILNRDERRRGKPSPGQSSGTSDHHTGRDRIGGTTSRGSDDQESLQRGGSYSDDGGRRHRPSSRDLRSHSRDRGDINRSRREYESTDPSRGDCRQGASNHEGGPSSSSRRPDNMRLEEEENYSCREGGFSAMERLDRSRSNYPESPPLGPGDKMKHRGAYDSSMADNYQSRLLRINPEEDKRHGSLAFHYPISPRNDPSGNGMESKCGAGGSNNWQGNTLNEGPFHQGNTNGARDLGNHNNNGPVIPSPMNNYSSYSSIYSPDVKDGAVGPPMEGGYDSSTNRKNFSSGNLRGDACPPMNEGNNGSYKNGRNYSSSNVREACPMQISTTNRNEGSSNNERDIHIPSVAMNSNKSRNFSSSDLHGGGGYNSQNNINNHRNDTSLRDVRDVSPMHGRSHYPPSCNQQDSHANNWASGGPLSATGLRNFNSGGEHFPRYPPFGARHNNDIHSSSTQNLNSPLNSSRNHHPPSSPFFSANRSHTQTTPSLPHQQTYPTSQYMPPGALDRAPKRHDSAFTNVPLSPLELRSFGPTSSAASRDGGTSRAHTGSTSPSPYPFSNAASVAPTLASMDRPNYTPTYDVVPPRGGGMGMDSHPPYSSFSSTASLPVTHPHMMNATQAPSLGGSQLPPLLPTSPRPGGASARDGGAGGTLPTHNNNSMSCMNTPFENSYGRATNNYTSAASLSSNSYAGGATNTTTASSGFSIPRPPQPGGEKNAYALGSPMTSPTLNPPSSSPYHPLPISTSSNNISDTIPGVPLDCSTPDARAVASPMNRNSKINNTVGGPPACPSNQQRGDLGPHIGPKAAPASTRSPALPAQRNPGQGPVDLVVEVKAEHLDTNLTMCERGAMIDKASLQIRILVEYHGGLVGRGNAQVNFNAPQTFFTESFQKQVQMVTQEKIMLTLTQDVDVDRVVMHCKGKAKQITVPSNEPARYADQFGVVRPQRREALLNYELTIKAEGEVQPHKRRDAVVLMLHFSLIGDLRVVV